MSAWYVRALGQRRAHWGPLPGTTAFLVRREVLKRAEIMPSLGRQFHQYVLWKEWILPVMGVVLTPSWWPPPVPDKLTQRGSSSANGTVAPLAHGVTSVTWPPGASWRAAAGLYLRCSRPNQLQSLHENSQPCWRLLSSAWHRTSENSSSVPGSSFRTEFQCREGSRGAVRSAAASCASHSS